MLNIFRKLILACLLVALTMGMVSATENSTADNLVMDNELTDDLNVEDNLIDSSDDNLLESSSNDVLEKGKQKTVITFEEREKYYVGSSIAFQLKSGSGEGLADKYIEITANSDKFNLTTEDGGEFYLDILGPGEISFSVSFKGDSKYYSSSFSKTIYGLSTIKMDKLTKIYNGAIEYSSTFYDTEGNLLKDSKILFNVDGSSSYSKTTNNRGVATLFIPIKKGNHIIYAYNPVSDEVAGEYVKVFDRISENKNLNIYFGYGTYKIRVFDDNGNHVKAGEKVTIKINNKKYVVKTDKNGYAKLKINSQPGKYSISATYKGFEVINSLKVKPILIPKLFKIKKLGKTFKISAKLLNGKGKPAHGKKITVKFNGKKYKAKTNKKGIAKFTLKTPRKLGDYKIKYSCGKAKASLTGTLYRR